MAAEMEESGAEYRTWLIYPGTVVVLPRRQIEMLIRMFDAFDSIPFVWRDRNGDYQFVLMPRTPQRSDA